MKIRFKDHEIDINQNIAEKFFDRTKMYRENRDFLADDAIYYATGITEEFHPDDYVRINDDTAVICVERFMTDYTNMFQPMGERDFPGCYFNGIDLEIDQALIDECERYFHMQPSGNEFIREAIEYCYKDSIDEHPDHINNYGKDHMKLAAVVYMKELIFLLKPKNTGGFADDRR